MTVVRRPTRLDADQVVRTFFADPDWMFKTGIGGTANAVCLVLAIASPLLAPVVIALMSLVSGYLLKVIRFRELAGEGPLPPWEGWLELLISGLTWQAIQFGWYLLVVSVVTVSLVLGSSTGIIKGYHPQFPSWVLACTLLTAASWTFISFFARYLMVSFAVEERIGAGFAVKEVLCRAARRPGDFLYAWLLSIGFQLAAIVLPAMTIIGVCLIPSTLFVADVLGASLAVQVWGSGRRA